jgi:hypothetical protein
MQLCGAIFKSAAGPWKTISATIFTNFPWTRIGIKMNLRRIPQERYKKEFRVEAVKLLIKQGLSIPEISRLPESTTVTGCRPVNLERAKRDCGVFQKLQAPVNRSRRISY